MKCKIDDYGNTFSVIRKMVIEGNDETIEAHTRMVRHQLCIILVSLN